jgi:hypothetical protein
VDHLVVMAASLGEGVAWCEARLGVTPGPGGAHPLMGTHNRLLRIGTPRFPRAYLEIVAIDPGATPTRPPPLRRWFDMDDDALRATLASGPRLGHFVASVPDVQAAVAALAAQGIDRGQVIEASRETPRGLLQWRITVRDDGRRLFGGALPTLIEWGADVGGSHPGESLPDCGLSLTSLRLSHPQSAALQTACAAIGMSGVEVDAGAAGLCAELLTPRGPVVLSSAST